VLHLSCRYRGWVMPTPLASPKEKHVWSSDPGRRRSMRVLLSIPVIVAGKNPKGADFKEDTRTLVVNAHGALVALAAQLPAGQKVVVTNVSTQQSAECTVAYIGSTQGGKMQMGLEFVNPAPSFWQIDFPPDDWVVPDN